jgi:hypothetical protein
VTDPDVQPADLDVPLADPDRPPADPDSIAGTGPAAAVEAALSGVVLAEESPEATAPIRPAEVAGPSAVVAAYDSPGAANRTPPPEAATRTMPTGELPDGDSLGQPPLGDSLGDQVARLVELDELSVGEHIARYEAVHDELHAALRGIHDPGG